MSTFKVFPTDDEKNICSYIVIVSYIGGSITF